MDDKNKIFALKQITDSEAAIRAATGERTDYSFGALITSRKFPWYKQSNALVNYNPSADDDTERIVMEAESAVKKAGCDRLTLAWCPELVNAKVRARIEEETFLLDFATGKKTIFAWVKSTKPPKSPAIEIVQAVPDWDMEFYGSLFDDNVEIDSKSANAREACKSTLIHSERLANLAGYTQFFAHANDKPVGRISLCNGLADGSGVYGRIKSLYIAPDMRRRGIAAALLDRVIAHARDAGCLIVGLLTEKDNPARYLYKEMGFTELGEYWVGERKIGK